MKTNNPFYSKRVLVTGARGFIGTNLAHKLIEYGAEVHGTSRSVNTHNGIVWWQGTFEKLENTRKIFEAVKPDFVFHMSGEITAANDPKFILPTYHSLATSTVNLLTAALEFRIEKIILTGSSTEPTDHLTPNSPYSASKLVSNSYAKLFQETYGLPVTVVRPFMGYGPTQPKMKIIPHAILSFLKGDDLLMTSGSWMVDWIYINDLVDGIIAAAVSKNRYQNPYDLGTGNLTSVKNVIERIAEIMKPKGKILFGALPDRPFEPHREPELTYTHSQLNWQAKTTLDEGLIKTIEWYTNEFHKRGSNKSSSRDMIRTK